MLRRRASPQKNDPFLNTHGYVWTGAKTKGQSSKKNYVISGEKGWRERIQIALCRIAVFLSPKLLINIFFNNNKYYIDNKYKYL